MVPLRLALILLAFAGAIETSCSVDNAETCHQKNDASVLLQGAVGVQHASVLLAAKELDDVESTQLAVGVVEGEQHESQGDEDDDKKEDKGQEFVEEEQLPASFFKSHTGDAANTPPTVAKAPAGQKPAGAVKAKGAVVAKSAVAAKAAAATKAAAAAKTAAAAKAAVAAKVAAAAKAAAGAKVEAAAKTAAAAKIAAAAKTAAAKVEAAAVAAKTAVAAKAAASGSPVAPKPATQSKTAASTWFHWPSLGTMPLIGEDPEHLWKIGGETNWDQLLGPLIISFVLLLVATMAERSSETGLSMQPPSQTRAGARMVNIDVLKFLCMCGVTYFHQFMCNATTSALVGAFFLSGFTLVAGMQSKDGGRGIMSAKAIRGCCTLLAGACLFNVLFTSLFGVMYAEGLLKLFNLNPALATQIHLGTAPLAWYVLAIVMWRAIVTPLYNMLANAGGSEMEACCGTLSMCILARFVMPEVCKQLGSWAVVYYRISFYAPFFAVGLAVKDAQLPTRLRTLSTILAGVFLLCVIGSSFTKPTDGPWSELAHYVTQTTGYYPRTAAKQESLMGIIVQISMSLSFVVTILEAVRLCYSSLLALGPEPLGSCIEGVGTWGSRSLTAYMLNYPLMMIARGSCDHSFVVAGLPVSEIFRIICAIVVTIFFCSGPVDKILGPVVRPAWLLDILLSPIQGKGPSKSISEPCKTIGEDPYQGAWQRRIPF